MKKYDGIRNKEELMAAQYGERYHRYRENWRTAGQRELLLPYPLQLDLDLVNNCNLNCTYCDSKTMRARDNKPVDMELLVKRLPEARKLGTESINIGSSYEPLLRPGLARELMDKVGELGFIDSYLHTNGTLLTAEISETIIQAGIKTVCISLDAFSLDTFKELRGADLNKVKENIHRLLALRNAKKSLLPFLRVSFVLSDANFPERDEFVAYWQKYADVVDIQEFYLPPGVAKHPEYEYRPIEIRCGQPWQRLQLTPHGEYVACCRTLGSHSDCTYIGPVRELTISEAWNAEPVQALRRRLAAGEALPEPCQSCQRGFYMLAKAGAK